MKQIPDCWNARIGPIEFKLERLEPGLLLVTRKIHIMVIGPPNSVFLQDAVWRERAQLSLSEMDHGQYWLHLSSMDCGQFSGHRLDHLSGM